MRVTAILLYEIQSCGGIVLQMDAQIYNDASMPVVTYSVIQGVYAGGTNDLNNRP